MIEHIETSSFQEFTAAVADARSRGLEVNILSPSGDTRVYAANASSGTSEENNT